MLPYDYQEQKDAQERNRIIAAAQAAGETKRLEKPIAQTSAASVASEPAKIWAGLPQGTWSDILSHLRTYREFHVNEAGLDSDLKKLIEELREQLSTGPSTPFGGRRKTWCPPWGGNSPTTHWADFLPIAQLDNLLGRDASYEFRENGYYWKEYFDATELKRIIASSYNEEDSPNRLLIDYFGEFEKAQVKKNGIDLKAGLFTAKQAYDLVCVLRQGCVTPV